MPVFLANCSAPSMRAGAGRGGGLVEMLGQAVDLLGIEQGVAFEERNLAFDFVAVVVGSGLADIVGIDDERAVLALADLPAMLGRLAIRHPDRRGVAPGDCLAPQHQHVDALVGLAVAPQWPCDPACDCRSDSPQKCRLNIPQV